MRSTSGSFPRTVSAALACGFLACSSSNVCLDEDDCASDGRCVEGTCVVAPDGGDTDGGVPDGGDTNTGGPDAGDSDAGVLPECEQGTERACFNVPGVQDGEGTCRAGRQLCTDGSWGRCIDAIEPLEGVCDVLSCTGGLNPGCVCLLGETEPCSSGAAGTDGAGACRAGTRTCEADTSGMAAWSDCRGEVLPASRDACAPADATYTTHPEDDLTCDGTLEARAPSLAPTASASGSSSMQAGSHAFALGVPVSATVTFDAGEQDADGLVGLAFEWRVVSSPTGSTGALVHATTRAPTFTPDLAGDYVIALRATDTTGCVAEERTVLLRAAAPVVRPPCTRGPGFVAWRIRFANDSIFAMTDVYSLPDDSNWTAAPVYQANFVDRDAGGGVELPGNTYLLFRYSVAGLTTIRGATLSVHGRSYHGSSAGSFRALTSLHGSVDAPADSMSNGLPYAWQSVDFTGRVLAGEAPASTEIRMYAGATSYRLVVNQVELCIDGE